MKNIDTGGLTLKQLKAAGYRETDRTYERGYVSHRIDPDQQVARSAGGNRKGQLYVLLPAYNTTQYCIRQYLKKD